MNLKIALIPGDGIGKEVMNELLKVVKELDNKGNLSSPFDTEVLPYDADYFLKDPNNFSIDVSIFKKNYNAVLLGALGDKRVPDNLHAKKIIGGIRRDLDLFVNFRPFKLRNIDYTPLKHIKSEDEIDFVVFRENTEDIYAGIGGYLKKGQDNEIATEVAIYTKPSVERIIKEAFRYATKHNLSSVVMADKSNVMQYIGGMWQDCFCSIAKDFPKIEASHMYIDALSMEIIRNPKKFDVIVTSNLFGDIISDESAQIIGGLGVSPSVNYNPNHDNFYGLFEPVHGSAPDIYGKQIANPLAMIESLFLLLQKAKIEDKANILNNAIRHVLLNNNVTSDLGGKFKTSEVGDIICKYIREF